MATPNQNFTFVERTASYWFLAVPAVFGSFIFCLGFFDSLIQWKDVFFGVGGTIFGSSLGTVFGLLAGARLQMQVVDVQRGLDSLLQTHVTTSAQLYQQISDTLSKAIQFPWSTDEKTLKIHRRCQHWYYRTRKGNDEFWMYLPLDFSERFEPGRLYSQRTVPMLGREYKYEYDGLLIGMRLVVITKALEHGEPVAISIIRDYGMGLGEDDGYWGLYFHSDWNKDEGVDPCILVHEPFEGTGNPGRQTSVFGEKLKERWKSLAPETGINVC
jgi:hypothetical protein